MRAAGTGRDHLVIGRLDEVISRRQDGALMRNPVIV
jgi:hypothetical protein